jgi:hypothetical protein
MPKGLHSIRLCGGDSRWTQNLSGPQMLAARPAGRISWRRASITAGRFDAVRRWRRRSLPTRRLRGQRADIKRAWDALMISQPHPHTFLATSAAPNSSQERERFSYDHPRWFR